jgi:hypothetical protein
LGQPAWTAAMYQPKSGMDHLGLASVSQDRILPTLSPGINVLTVHPRYWSIYTWLLTEFWDRELPRTKSAWGRFLKPRERVFVAAVLSCPRHGQNIPQVGGQRVIGRELDGNPLVIDPLATYLKASEGGYPIYASAIAQHGLTMLERNTSQFGCDAPTEGGRRLGLTVRDWIKRTRYFQEYFDTVDRDVPIEVIAEYAERICVCRLTDGPDCPLLQDAFLHGGDPDLARRRRSSLRLVCDMSEQTSAQPVRPWAFRQLVYYRRDDDQRSYQPSQPDLVPTARQWRLYQHREFVAWACNRWLQHIVRWGLSRNGDSAPIPLHLVLDVVDRMNFAALATALGVPDPQLTARDPLSSLLNWVRHAGRVTGGLDDPWDLTAPACEDRLVDHLWNLDQDGDDVTAAIMALLTLCASRLWPREYQIRFGDDWSLVCAGGPRRLSVQILLRDMRDHVDREASIGDASRWFLEHYVIRQHHRVALTKLPDDTFRLRLDAGRIRFVDEPGAVDMNDSRFRALSITAAEFGWTAPMEARDHRLSHPGRELVGKGDLPRVGPSAVSV